MKHTEGNWFVTNSGGTVTTDNKSMFTKICTLETVPLKITEEVCANARLIAAAPELLKSLEYVVKFIKLCPKLKEEDQPKGLEKWQELIEKINKI